MNRARIIGSVVVAAALVATGVLIGAMLPSSELLNYTSGDHGPDDHAHGPDDHAHGPDDHAHGADDHAHGPDDHAHGADDHAHGEDQDHEEVVALLPTAVESLGLKQATVRLSNVWRNLRIPASIVEKPGQSAHSLAAPINGIVERIYTVPGQAVSPGDALFDLRVTDEALSQAQVDLLQVITRMDVIDAELKRLEPLIQSGSVSGRRKRDLVYERQQKDAQRQLHIQELLVRGLDSQQVDEIMKSRELMRRFTVRVTGHSVGHNQHDHDGPDYSVEALFALPGATVKRGDDLCRMAYHAELYLVGSAFENELDQVVQATEQQRNIVATFGTQGSEYRRKDLSIEFIDNHVDDKSQTFSFYIPLKNEVVRDFTNSKGVRFRTWRFKPGQRAHLEVPVEEFADHIRLPIASVASDGATNYIFQRLDHPHEEIEFERIPVQVVYQDSQYAVLKNDGALKIGDDVVANRAYELNLEMKAEAGGGGAHHGHDH